MIPAPELGHLYLSDYDVPGAGCVICEAAGVILPPEGRYYAANGFSGAVEACGSEHACELIYIYNELDKEAAAEILEAALGA